MVERKNRTVQEATRTMLNEAKLLDAYWKEVVYTTVYILNEGQIKVNKDKTTYELWYGRPTPIKYFKVFGSKCYIKRNEDYLGKYDSRTNEGIFLRYSFSKKEYRCFNKRSHKILESEYVRIDDIKPRNHDSAENTNHEDLQEDKSTHDEEEGIEKEDTQESEEDSPRLDTKNPSRRIQKNHPETQILFGYTGYSQKTEHLEKPLHTNRS